MRLPFRVEADLDLRERHQRACRQPLERISKLAGLALLPAAAVAERELRHPGPFALAVQEEPVPAVGHDHVRAIVDDLEPKLLGDRNDLVQVAAQDQDTAKLCAHQHLSRIGAAPDGVKAGEAEREK